MQAIRVKQPGGLDNLALVDTESRDPGPGEIRVRNHASSLNFHDYCVVIGLLPVEQDRIPMSDGAGLVEAVGEGVTEFAVGDKVMSAFFPNWEDGGPSFGKISGVPGDGLVSVDETRLEGSTEHHIVPAIHTFLMNHPAVIRGAVSFLSRAPDR